MIQQRVLNFVKKVAKDRLLQNRIQARENAMLEENKIDKSRLSNDEKEEKKKKIRYRIKEQDRRISDCDMTIARIEKLIFEEVAADDVRLGGNKAYCDRRIMHYESSIESLDDKSLTETILCAFFNSMQDYFTLYKLTESRQILTRFNSQLMMYHIGVIECRLLYGGMVSARPKKVYERYPDFDEKYISFFPTQSGCDDMIAKAVFDNEDGLYGKIDASMSTSEAMQIKLLPYRWYCYESGIRQEHDDNVYNRNQFEVTIYLKEDEYGCWRRHLALSREIKDHRGAHQILKKFADAK